MSYGFDDILDEFLRSDPSCGSGGILMCAGATKKFSDMLAF